DVLRALQKTPGALDMLDRELAEAATHPAIARHVAALHRTVHEGAAPQNARRITEGLALGLQAALLHRHAPPEVTEAFIAARLDGEGGLAFGTLPPATACAAIVARACAG